MTQQALVEHRSTSPAATLRTVGVLANPYSGSGPNRRHVDRLVQTLTARGLEPHVAWTPAERSAFLADPALTDTCRCIVAAGGDGSIADAINGMHTHGHLGRVPFATLPVGTENLFAREFGFTRNPARLADAVAAGHTRLIDLGDAGGRLFHLMASAGFDAEVVHRMARWRSIANGNGHPGHATNSQPVLRRVNRLSYLPRMINCVCAYRFPQVAIEVDGQRHTGSHLFVFNLPQYGGNLGIGRHACCTDAKLDWVLFQNPGLASLAGYAWTVLRARHLRLPHVLHGSATRLRIVSEIPDSPIPIQADGDPAGFTPTDIQIRPAALRVVTTGPHTPAG